jgi:hypothetical protein
MTPNCSQVKTLVRMTSTQMNFPEKLFGYANPQFHQLSLWLVSDDPAGEAACGGLGLAWLHVVCGCEGGWTYCQII